MPMELEMLRKIIKESLTELLDEREFEDEEVAKAPSEEIDELAEMSAIVESDSEFEDFEDDDDFLDDEEFDEDFGDSDSFEDELVFDDDFEDDFGFGSGIVDISHSPREAEKLLLESHPKRRKQLRKNKKRKGPVIEVIAPRR